MRHASTNKVYVIFGDTGGGHESPPLLGIYSTKEAAAEALIDKPKREVWEVGLVLLDQPVLLDYGEYARPVECQEWYAVVNPNDMSEEINP